MNISVTVCYAVCVFVRLFYLNLAASNSTRLFTDVQGRESPILGNFAPPEAQNRPANRPARALNYT